METAASPAQLESRHKFSLSDKKTRLSCVNCRKRKVKCDRKEPFCTQCERHQDQCCYPTERKRVVRRSAYKDMAQRLEKMERLISDFAIDPSSLQDSASPHSASEGSPSDDLPKDKVLKRSPTTIMDSTETPDSTWATWAKAVPSLEEGLHREPYRVNRFLPSLLSGETNSYSRCSIFSPPGIQHVNQLVGDQSFSQMLSNVKPTNNTRPFDFDNSVRQPLPPRDLLLACLEDFFFTLNNDMSIFQEEVVMEGTQKYLKGDLNPGTAWYAAINIIVAHVTRSNPAIASQVGPPEEYEKYLYNAMRVIPSLIMLQPANELSIGALLSIVMYFTFYFENEIAATILGLAIQQMIVSGYQHARKPAALTELQYLHRRRLYWHGFAFDSDLSLRMGKPPIISDNQIMDLPDEFPIDGLNLITYNGGTFNFLREYVAMSTLQNKTYALIYSDKRANQSTEELQASIDELDEELQRWKENIPDIVKPQASLDRTDYGRLICVTVLHYSYFQLTIAIHSAVFGGFENKLPDERDERIMSSVALCVVSARASISLLNHHDNTHPFTVYLLNHVAWSVDILFMNILHNKTSPRVYEDLELLEMILRYYEKYDRNRNATPAYKITKGLYGIGMQAVRIAQSPPPFVYSNMNALPQASFQNGIATSLPTRAVPPDSNNGLDGMHIAASFTPPINNMAWTNNGMDHTFVEPEWMLPMGFQPEYWQDSWANVFQDPDMSDLSLQGL